MSTALRHRLNGATWRKSSYSNTQGGECLEVAQDFPGAATWHKSTYSDTQGGDCLEVADGPGGLVPVRDSKRPAYAPLVAHAPAWTAFVSAVKSGHLDG